MKITSEEISKMKEKISKVICKFELEGIDLVYRYENGFFPRSDKVKDLQKRLCFDLLYMSEIDVIYLYNEYKCNDDHIYTVLKRICPPVTKKY
jgi:hypothetical protein